jgi:hypothetical protein
MIGRVIVVLISLVALPLLLEAAGVPVALVRR